jgi:hypothetical protein
MLAAALALLSGAALAYEVLLTRLFAIIQWHHFAYMVISLALLGFGASGTLLALAGDRLARRAGAVFLACGAIFGVTAVGAAVLAARVPFNALEILWSPRQPLYLVLLYLLLAVPFASVAACVGIAFIRFPERIATLYRANLVGSGLGALLVVPALELLTPAQCLRGLAAAALLGTALAALDRALIRAPRIAALLALAAAAVALAGPGDARILRMSPYKGLSLALRAPGARIVDQRSGPLALLTLVRSPEIPFRYAPGLSLDAPVEPPEQLGVYADGEWLGPLSRGGGAQAAYLDWMTSALPYHLLAGGPPRSGGRQVSISRPRVLVLGAGTGTDVLQARVLGARAVDAVELNPDVVALARAQQKFTGGVYNGPGTRVRIAEARRFLAGGSDRYDLIQLGLLDSFGASAAGLHALSANHLYTVEAFGDALARLGPGGMIAITRWLALPPRDTLKLIATAALALERAGARDPARRIALIRSLRTVTLLVGSGELGEVELSAIRKFCEERGFDAVWPAASRTAPGAEAHDLGGLDFTADVRALLGAGRDAFIRRYKFRIAPATDDRPWFHHFFGWRALPEILALRGQGGIALLDWGYFILAATLVQAVAASALLILLPLRAIAAPPGARAPRAGVLVYFAALGTAFMCVEIAFIQRFTLFLGHPLAAISVVLAGFLLFAGLGSAASERLAARAGAGRTAAVAAAAIALLAGIYLLALPPLFRALIPLADTAREAVTLALIAPLAFLMGIPFPLGLSRLGRAAPPLVPWAWGINGCASVIGAVLATLLAMEIGFSGVIALAMVLYPLAALAFRKLPGP